jgi:hypothetical protein
VHGGNFVLTGAVGVSAHDRLPRPAAVVTTTGVRCSLRSNRVEDLERDMRDAPTAARGRHSARRALVGVIALAVAATSATGTGCGEDEEDPAQNAGERVERRAGAAEEPSNGTKDPGEGKEAARKAEKDAQEQEGGQTTGEATQELTQARRDIRQQKKAARGGIEGGGATRQSDAAEDLAEQEAGGSAGGTSQGDAAQDIAEQEKAAGG